MTTKLDFYEQIENPRWVLLQDLFHKGPNGKMNESFFLETTKIIIIIRWAKQVFVSS